MRYDCLYERRREPRKYQFSLRTLLLLISVASVLAMGYTHFMPAYQARTAKEVLRSYKCTIGLDGSLNVISVEIAGNNADAMARLGDLPDLRSLTIRDLGCSTSVYLRRLTHLRHLLLERPELSDNCWDDLSRLDDLDSLAIYDGEKVGRGALIRVARLKLPRLRSVLIHGAPLTEQDVTDLRAAGLPITIDPG